MTAAGRSEVCKWYALCPMKRLLEAGRLSREWVERYCFGDWLRCERFRLEEQGIEHPDHMLPDGSLDEALC
jgi:hypothetical protein